MTTHQSQRVGVEWGNVTATLSRWNREVCCYDTSSSAPHQWLQHTRLQYIKQWYESEDKTNTNRRDTNSVWYWIYLCSIHTVRMNKQSNKQSFQLSEGLNTQKSTRVEEHSKSDGGKLLKSKSQETPITLLLHVLSEDSISTHAPFFLFGSRHVWQEGGNSVKSVEWAHHSAGRQQLSIFKCSRLCLHLFQSEALGEKILIQEHWHIPGQQPVITGASHNNRSACKEWRIFHLLNTRY